MVVKYLKSLKQQWVRPNWPKREINNCDSVSIVFASYNTFELTSYLLFSIFRILGSDKLSRIVAIDNNSTDGSFELLEKFSKEGMIELIRNRKQAYHGPSINQAIHYLAKLENYKSMLHTRYIWILDSDVIILKSDALDDAVSFIKTHNAAAVGQFQYDALPEGYAHISSLLIDPCKCWRRSIRPFDNTGAPAANFQRSLRSKGLKVANFPFRAQGYVLHLCRGTLRSIYHLHDKKNIYYEWASKHFDHHYHGDPNGAHIHQKFLKVFAQEVSDLTPESLLSACQRPDLLKLFR